MCNTVIKDGHTYSTPGELAELLGGMDKLVWQETNPFRRWDEAKDWRDPDLCLCPVDLKATLRASGLNWELGADPMEHYIRS